MSKSGLFAHFGSREELLLAVLAHGQAEFTEVVFQPAMAKPRGLPRLKAMFTNWLDWTESAELPGGCPMIGGATEFDDKPGPVRDMLAGGQRTWIETLKRTVRQAIEEGQLPADTDPEQIAFEMFGIALVVHHHRRLLGYPKARARALAALDKLLSRVRKDYAMPYALSLPRISTNVRFAASRLLFPELAGAWAERMFLTPPRGETPPRARST